MGTDINSYTLGWLGVRVGDVCAQSAFIKRTGWTDYSHQY